ncbi:pre-mRNA-splicing factor CWC22 [Biomphalaria glabrata]|nr:putative pre-mRNA-splicing factor CWC22 [Biomphalaria glabrata]
MPRKRQDSPRNGHDKSENRQDSSRKGQDKNEKRQESSRNGQGKSENRQDSSRSGHDKSEKRQESSRNNQDKSENRQNSSRSGQDKSENRHDSSRSGQDKSENRHDSSRSGQDKSENRHDSSRNSWDKSENRHDSSRSGQDKSETSGKGPLEAGKKSDDLMSRTGGAYIPPAKLRMMQEQISDKSSTAYQRMSWEALKKSINGLINKVNISNLINIVKELFQENIVRGRGLLARSMIQAQAASPTFTHVYAALVAVINTKFPQNGELILRRLILMFRRGYRRNDKNLCLSTTRFIAHLVNQQVAHEVIALEILTLLLETPTDDSVEVAIGFLKECGQKLTEVSPRGINSIFERLRNVLHEGQLDVRVQYMVEVMFAIRKDGFKDHPAVLSDLDLVEEAEQFTHLLQLEDAVSGDEMLNIFHEDPNFLENEEKYKELKKEILDEGSSDEESGDESGESGSTDSDDDEEEAEKAEAEKQAIIDKTETNLVALRRVIYLTVQSSLDVNECAHKMLKMDLKPGQEVELCNMILDCCAQLRTYEKFFGLLGQRFCQIDKKYVEPFQQIFVDQYDTIHRLETQKLRNVAKFFAHLLHTDAISWGVLSVVKLTEDDTSSASRIFLKILFQELAEYMGLLKLNERLKDPTLAPFFAGIMPRDNPRNTRFSINFFTTIGLGGLTDELREHLKVMNKMAQQKQEEEEKSSSSESSDTSSESDSSSDSEDEPPKRKKQSKKQKASENDREKARNKDDRGSVSKPHSKQMNGRKSSPTEDSISIADRLLNMAQYGQTPNGKRREKGRRDKSSSPESDSRSQQRSRKVKRKDETKEQRDRSRRNREDSGGERRHRDNRKEERERRRNSIDKKQNEDRYNDRRHNDDNRWSDDKRRQQEEEIRKSTADYQKGKRKNYDHYEKKRHDSSDSSEEDLDKHDHRRQIMESKSKKRHRLSEKEEETKSKKQVARKRKISEASSKSDDSSTSSSESSSTESSSEEEEVRRAKKSRLGEHKNVSRHRELSREKARVEDNRSKRR